jgi:uncharacterized protein (TIGR02444 family)
MNDAKSFWPFSLRFYSNPAIQTVFLDLQDQFGADVNVVLYGLWQALKGRRLSERDIRAVIELVGAWQLNVVLPLRKLREVLKTSASPWPLQAIYSLRERVKGEELQAEHLQQVTMETTFADIGEPDTERAAAMFNTQTYARILGVTFPSAHLQALVNAVLELWA